MRAYLIVLLVAGAVSYLTTPAVRWAALRVGAVDVPNDRKVHTTPTPTMGGLAMYAALFAGLAVAWVLPEFRDLFRTSSEPLGVLGAGTVLVILGVVDDNRPMRAPTKLAAQTVAAGVLVLFGVQIFYFWLPGVGVVSLSSDLAALLTVVWTIAVVNAVNLIDGLDGLAAGVVAIAAVSFFIYAYQSAGGEPTTAGLLTVIVAGACAGFLRHNWHPAKIIMGDTGAYLLGAIMASATVSGIGRTTEPQFIDVAGFIVPVLLPLMVLAIPLADAGFAVLRRVRDRRPVFHPDKQHIHHWLLDMARSYRQAVGVMYLWSAMLAAAALVLALGPGLVWRVLSIAIAAALVASIMTLPRLMRRRSVLRVVREDEGARGRTQRAGDL